MAEWKHHDELWLVRQEQIGPEAWLLCFLPQPDRGISALADGWVNVLEKEWHAGQNNNYVLERYELYDTGPLELECIAHEMRKKYGSEA